MTDNLTDKTGASVDVSQDEARGCFAITLVDNGEEAGRAFYLDRDNDGVDERVFYHTEVDEEFGGRGLATLLVQDALAQTRETGRLVVPVCPLVKKYLDTHTDELAGTFRRTTPADFEWVKAQVNA